GRQLRGHRERRHMTQQQLGQSLTPPTTRASIANIEAGKQRVLVHTLVQLADVLGLALDELLPQKENSRHGDVREELLKKLPMSNKQHLRRVVDRLAPA